jgi:hypothetical protein
MYNIADGLAIGVSVGKVRAPCSQQSEKGLKAAELAATWN